MKRYTKEDQSLRIERFLTFLSQQGVLHYQLKSKTEESRKFAVSLAYDLALVDFTYTGHITITAKSGKLKVMLLSWANEQTHFTHEAKLMHELEEIEKHRYLLEGPLAPLPTQGTSAPLILLPADNPLVDLAQRLGYQVYLANPSGLALGEARYHIVGSSEQACDGESLVETLARLLRQDLAHGKSDSPDSAE